MRRAVLAAVRLKGDREFEQKLAECERLCEACGILVTAVLVQNSRSPDPRTVFREGKLNELAAAVRETEADAVVFLQQLSAAVTGRLSEICGCEVLDRTALILDIFSRRAKSAQARMQVELARLEYEMPALIRMQEEEESHERGGAVTNRGSGEMRAAGLRRRHRTRIRDLRKRLDALAVKQDISGERRRKSGLRKAALVGYTNAGKSSLMNAFLRASGSSANRAEEKDMLFATLDTGIRRIEYGKYTFLLYDTVGFVSDLPHELVDAFHSTLSAACDADLLIEVTDASDPARALHSEITRDTLSRIGAGDIEILQVYNKIDLAERENFAGALCTDCRRDEGIKEVLDAVCARLYPEEVVMHCLLPYERMGMLKNAHSLNIRVLNSYEDGIMTEIRGEKVRALPFMKYRIGEEEYEDRMGKTE